MGEAKNPGPAFHREWSSSEAARVRAPAVVSPAGLLARKPNKECLVVLPQSRNLDEDLDDGAHAMGKALSPRARLARARGAARCRRPATLCNRTLSRSLSGPAEEFCGLSGVSRGRKLRPPAGAGWPQTSLGRPGKRYPWPSHPQKWQHTRCCSRRRRLRYASFSWKHLRPASSVTFQRLRPPGKGAAAATTR